MVSIRQGKVRVERSNRNTRSFPLRALERHDSKGNCAKGTYTPREFKRKEYILEINIFHEDGRYFSEYNPGPLVA